MGKTSGSGDTLERVVFGDQLFHPASSRRERIVVCSCLSRTTFARVNVFDNQEQQGYAEETALPGVERKVPDADDRRRQTDGERDDRLIWNAEVVADWGCRFRGSYVER